MVEKAKTQARNADGSYVKPKPFEIPANGKLPPNQANADRCLDTGRLRKAPCAECVKALKHASAELEWGRGNSKHCEGFCCVVSKEVGKNGKVCARCILQASSDCSEIPAHLVKEWNHIVKHVDLYNKIGPIPVSERTANETNQMTTSVEHLVKFGTKVTQFMAHDEEYQNTPRKTPGKRKFGALFESESVADKEGLARVERKIDELMESVSQVKRHAMDADRRARHARKLCRDAKATAEKMGFNWVDSGFVDSDSDDDIEVEEGEDEAESGGE